MKKNIKLALSLFIVFALFSGFRDIESRVSVSKKDLPKKAQVFIDEHFGDYYFLRATESGNYNVMFKGSTQITFTRDGDWSYISGQGNKLPTSFIDAKILKTLSSNYGEYSIMSIERKKKYYRIKLSSDTKLKIDMEGNIVK